ncbi:MAG: hypothetical protein MMC33_001181 [Icmadophila ericetorum]|nr:hypothetical protein [Icmadophila ericetorum]
MATTCAAAAACHQGITAPLYQELNYFRNIIEGFPFILKKIASPEASEFKFPLATLFTAPTREAGLSMTNNYAHALQEHGIAGIELGFEDPSSQFILDVIQAMGCTPDSHSSTQGALWDVKFQPEGVISEGTGKAAHSISHSLGEFAWHTDGAFEEDPTRFFGFHILHPDRQGGGVFRVLRAEDLLQMLSPQTLTTLTNFEYDLRVPPEFYKGQHIVKAKLLTVDQETGRAFVRYRGDILHDPSSSNHEACVAVHELKRLLDNPEGVGSYVPEYIFKENTVLLMDNARFLHSRTNIKDPKRWLRRVRFHGMPGESSLESGDISDAGFLGIPEQAMSASAAS